MKNVLKVLFNIFRGLCRVTGFFIVLLFTLLIKLLTLEHGKSKEITVRKARRIRFFSKFKLWIFNNVPEPVLQFFGNLTYKDYINTHLKNGLQLRYQ